MVVKKKKPLPPPGLPSVSQRVNAIKLSARAHTLPKSKGNMDGHLLVLPEDIKPSTEIPSMITFPSLVDEMDEKPRFCKVRRPRFLRSKNKDIYPRNDDIEKAQAEK